MYDLGIVNGYVYQQGVFEKLSIGINKGKIEYLGPDKIDAKELIDAHNKAILPGLINGHIHFGEYFLKGYKGKKTTEEYIKYSEAFAISNERYKEEIRKISTEITLVNALEAGTTTLMGIRGFDYAEQFKARLLMGYPLMKSKKLGNYLDNAFDNIVKLKTDKLSEYFVALHSILWVDEEILDNLSKFLKDHSFKLSIHISETKLENELVYSKYNMSPVELLNKYQLLSEHTLLVHCNYLSNKDLELISKNKASIAICPNSNLKLANDLPAIDKISAHKINMMVATDGQATNDSLNLWNSLKTVGLINDFTVEELFDLITINPAKYLKNLTGKIEKGYNADLIIYDLDDINIVNANTLLSDLIYDEKINVQYSIIGGKIVINNFQLIEYNKKQLLADKNKLLLNLDLIDRG